MLVPAAVYNPLRPGGAGSIFLALRLQPEPEPATIMSRTLAQVGLGGAASDVLAAQLSREALKSGLLGPIAALMMAVGLLVCALRALRIQPAEALK